MRYRLPKLTVATTAVALALTAGLLPGQPPLPQPGQPPAAQPQQGGADNNGMEVLARGPVHEAYADTAAISAEMPLVPRMPPDGIDELPPDHKPDGNNVQWIPGYWHWDEDRKDFTWISGFWRAVPPGRVWVPGSWRGVQDQQGQNAWQWVPGFWQEAPQQAATTGAAAAPQQDVQYLPQPPATLEAGPTAVAPSATSFYMPGGWVWRNGRYMWRPGTWYEYRPGWVWVPGYYRWSPIGYVYVEGYWDYPLDSRGVIYAPIGYTAAVYAQPGYVYTPTYVISSQCMMGAMFSRRGWGCYYFGDYYGPQYGPMGYTAWCGTAGPNGFVVYGAGPRWGYDPLWSYYGVAYRGSPAWRDGYGALYVGRYAGDPRFARPPVTMVEQTVIINRVTNVTVVNVNSGMTVVGGSITVGGVNVSGLAMVAPTRLVVDMHPGMRIAPLPLESRRREAIAAREIRAAAAERMRRENEVVRRGGGIPRDAAGVHSMKMEVSRAAMAHAEARDEKRALPPHPNKTAEAAHAAGPAGHGGEPARPGEAGRPGETGRPGEVARPGEPAGHGGTVPGKGPTPPGKVDPKQDPKAKSDPKRDPRESRDSRDQRP